MTPSRLHITASCALAAACTGRGCREGGDTADQRPCDVELVETVPADGATDAFYRDDIELEFDGDPGDVQLGLSGPDGDVPGTTWKREGREQLTGEAHFRVGFSPGEPLLPSTAYVVDVVYCSGAATMAFATSEAGSPVDPEALAGRTWSFDLRAGRMASPEGFDTLVLDMLLSPVFSLEVASTEGDETLVLRGLLYLVNPDDGPNTCPGTSEVVADFSENPYFTADIDDAELGVIDRGDCVSSVSATDLVVSGAFSPLMEEVEGGRVVGALSTSDIAAYADQVECSDSPDEWIDDSLCDAPIECISCPDEDDGQCMPFVVDKLSGTEQHDLDGDGWPPCRGDCDDGDPAVHPGADDTCGDGIDQDCDGADAACDTGTPK